MNLCTSIERPFVKTDTPLRTALFREPAMTHHRQHLGLTRRASLQRMGTGLGVIGLAGILSREGALAAGPQVATAASPLAPKASHFAPRAKRIIHLFMNGGPSQVDTFDPKPALEKYNGKRPPSANLKTERKTGGLMKSPFKFAKYGESGIEVSELFPHVASCIDEICVIRSMHTNIPNPRTLATDDEQW